MRSVGRHGAGSITTRKTGPPYQVSITMPGGKRVYRYAQSEELAEAALKELIDQRDRDLDPSRQTVADFLRSWIASLRDAKRQRVRPTTLKHYQLVVEHRIIPALGKYRLSKLRERQVQAWIDASGGSARTIHHSRAVLRRALNVAVRQRLIERNPAIGIELPDATYDGQRPLTVDEARALLEATVDDRLAPLWRLALNTGLRQAELLGLGWDDLDLYLGTVTVTSQLQRIDGRWARTPTKAARRLTVLSLDPATVAALTEHKRRMAEERRPDWIYHGLVFVTSTGNPFHAAHVLKEWKAACRKAGIPERRFHDLRGSTATLMADLGVPEDVRMARLGHATVTMARRYAGPSQQQDRAASGRLGEALRKAE